MNQAWNAGADYQMFLLVGCACDSSKILKVKKTEVKHPALRVPPGGNQVDGLPPDFNHARLVRNFAFCYKYVVGQVLVKIL